MVKSSAYSLSLYRVHKIRWMAAGLFVAAFLIRSYRLAHDPLWFDELFGFMLGQNGVDAILRNSLTDPHPPFYYLLQWVASGFGLLRTEWGLRWPSVISGAAAVPFLFLLARRLVRTPAAFAAASLLALSPAHLYFSQEARSFAFVMLLAVVAIWLVLKIEEDASRTDLWVSLGLVTLLGIYTSYSFILIAGIQVLYLPARWFRLRGWMIYLGIVILGALPLVPVLWGSLSRTLNFNIGAEALSLLRVYQTLLAGEPLRYGFHWGHTWLPLLLGFSFLLGAWKLLQEKNRPPASLYLALQLILPLAGFFGIAGPYLGIKLTLSESKQFMVLLPVFFLGAACGLDRLWNQAGFAGRLLAGFVLTASLAASLYGMQRYWDVSRSPEGLAVRLVMEQSRPEDAVVSLHYSLDAAANFYLTRPSVYYGPRTAEMPVRFPLSPLLVSKVQNAAPDTRPVAHIQAHPRIWLLSHDNTSANLLDLVQENCTVSSQQYFPPFHVTLLEACQP